MCSLHLSERVRLTFPKMYFLASNLFPILAFASFDPPYFSLSWIKQNVMSFALPTLFKSAPALLDEVGIQMRWASLSRALFNHNHQQYPPISQSSVAKTRQYALA